MNQMSDVIFKLFNALHNERKAIRHKDWEEGEMIFYVNTYIVPDPESGVKPFYIDIAYHVKDGKLLRDNIDALLQQSESLEDWIILDKSEKELSDLVYRLEEEEEERAYEEDRALEELQERWREEGAL